MFTYLRTRNIHLPQPRTTLDDSWQSIEISDLHPDLSLANEDTPPRGRKRNMDQGYGSPKSDLEPTLSPECTVSKKLRTRDLERCQYQSHDEIFDAVIKIDHRESRSLLNLPCELIIMILWRISNPLDLWCFSQVCRAIRNLIDEKLWQNLYIMQSPIWSSHVQINHLTGDVKMWSRIVLGDYLRRTLRWVEVSGNLPQAVKGKKLPRVTLDTYLHYRPSCMHPAISVSSAESQQWRNVGPPALFTDQSTNTTLSAYMQACSSMGRTDHRITMYEESDHNTPITIIPSSFWAHNSPITIIPDADIQPEPELATEYLGPPRLKDMKHFPIEDGKMRVVFVVAFSERDQMPADADDQDIYVEDVWSLLKIFEVYIQPEFSSCSSLTGSIPSRGRVETIVPRSRHIQIFKIYSAINQWSGQIEDRIALIGIHQGSRSQAVLMTGPLLWKPRPIAGYIKAFGPPARPPPLEHHVLGGMGTLKLSCMALFPAQSDFEHLLVILDQYGNGEIWDWMQRARISVLKLDVRENHLRHRDSLFYWGVHVNWAIEEPVYNKSSSSFSLWSGRRVCGDFRIVAMSYGEENEWESCWWDISEKELRNHLCRDPDPIATSQIRAFLTSRYVLNYGVQTTELLSPGNASVTVSQNIVHSISESVAIDEIWTIESSSRHFEHCTYGVFYPQYNLSTMTPSSQQLDIDGVSDSPLTFYDFQIWDHYRIAVTEENGICIFDMYQEDSCDILNDDAMRTPQLVLMIEDAEEDPLVGITVAGSCLLLTREYSHMVWRI